MKEYKEAYYILWRGISDAMEALSEQNYGIARLILLQAHISAEETYISWEEKQKEVLP